MARRISVDTDELRDAALRMERLSLSLEDIADGLRDVCSQLDGVSCRTDLLRRSNVLCRDAGGLVYRVHTLRGKLLFAAAFYEELDQRMRVAPWRTSNGDTK